MKKLATLVVLILMLFSIQTIAYGEESHGSFKSKFMAPTQNPVIAWLLAVLHRQE